MAAFTTLGVARVKITPREPVPLAGFGTRSGAFAGVTRDLHLRAFAFEGAGSRLVLVVADLIWWSESLVARLREVARERWQLAADQLLLHATHNHRGPQTSEQMLPMLGVAVPAYLDQLVAAVCDAVDAALAHPMPVLARHATGSWTWPMNRRLLTEEGVCVMAPNPDGPVERRVQAVAFEHAGEGRPVAMLAHVACHPSTSSVNSVSDEFPGRAAQLLEADMGGGAVAAVLQGFAGNARPDLTADGEFLDGDDADTDRIATDLALAAQAALERDDSVPRQISLGSALAVAPLPLDQLATPEAAGLSARELEEWARLSDPVSSPRLEVLLWRLTPQLSLLAVNAEVLVEYQRLLADVIAPTPLFLGYSNGMIGYLPTAAQLREGGYEPGRSSYLFGLSAPFAPDAEQVVVETARALTGVNTAGRAG